MISSLYKRKSMDDKKDRQLIIDYFYKTSELTYIAKSDTLILKFSNILDHNQDSIKNIMEVVSDFLLTMIKAETKT